LRVAAVVVVVMVEAAELAVLDQDLRL